jgi:hypothetical protein
VCADVDIPTALTENLETVDRVTVRVLAKGMIPVLSPVFEKEFRIGRKRAIRTVNYEKLKFLVRLHTEVRNR